jgi:hypothetical protein
LLIEEKTKLENPEQANERKNTLDAGEVHGTIAPLAPNNRISGIVKKAAGQLDSTGADISHDARIVWFTATGFDAETKSHQAFSTVYGATKVFDLDNSESLRDCFFFHNSAFYRFRDQLDGAVIASTDGKTLKMQLCLNPFSERWQQLRDSPIAKKFSTAVVDPLAKEAAGEVMIADTDIDRKDKEAVLGHLRTKYKIERLLEMPMNMVSASVAVKADS